MKEIAIEKAKSLKDCVFIDTRSPSEYEKDHIFGAESLPILDDEERAIVGTLYKRESPEKAYEKGYGFYEKKLNSLKKELLKHKTKKLIIYCWRGGLRSKKMAELAESLGLDSYRLIGGYKSYRRYLREKLYSYKLKARLVVIHGYTGSGKTELINRFSNSIDLEGLAQHRSSVFGSVCLKPRTQKMFETLLMQKLEELENEKLILIEGESKKIGNLFIPENIFRQMSKGLHILAKASLKTRAKRIVSEYLNNKEAIAQVKSLAPRIKKIIGTKKLNALLDMLEKNELYEFSEFLLKEYYDKLYSFSIGSYSYLARISTESIDDAEKHLKELISSKLAGLANLKAAN